MVLGFPALPAGFQKDDGVRLLVVLAVTRQLFTRVAPRVVLEGRPRSLALGLSFGRLGSLWGVW